MVTKAEKIMGVIAVIVMISLSIGNMIIAPTETRTDISVRAFTGIPAEDKLGGIEFGVSNRYGYHRVIFRVSGFDQGLNLDNVACKGASGQRYNFNKNSYEWGVWLKIYQEEVLVEATTGEKLNTSNTPSSK